MMAERLRRRHSLRWKLPVLISSLVTVVLATFLWLSYAAVSRTLMAASGARATEVANQLATMLVQSSQQRRSEMLRVADDPAVRAFVRERQADPAVVRARLATLALPNAVQRIELWNNAGERLVTLTAPADAVASSLPDLLPPSVTNPKPLRVHGSGIFSEAIVAVRGEDGSVADAGVLVVRRPLSAAGSDALNRLIGSGGVIEVGNMADDVWTDLGKRVPAPAVDLSRPGVPQYRVADGQRRIGALAQVRGTPWGVWLDFPETTVLAPARQFLKRMAAIGGAFVAIAAFMTALMSARITTPLQSLTQAAEAIAAGDYQRRVDSSRHDEIGRLGASFNAMTDQVAAMHRDLEQRVHERTVSLTQAQVDLEQRGAALRSRMQELAVVNEELEAFSYSVSHDLRAPLRHVTGFASLLAQRAEGALDGEGRRYLRTIIEAATSMGRLIDDLLAFSRTGRAALATQEIELRDLASAAQQDVATGINGRQISWVVHPLPRVKGDPALLRQVLTNLLANAVKYTGTRAHATIEIGTEAAATGDVVVFVRDNGVGFDPQYAHKLFGVFQRLHSNEEFDGTGIGLANVKRIIHRHGGRVWAEGRVGEGATFYFSLPSPGEHV